ncbi:MAG: pyridoxamine 5'-phosphate oxidase family protein, partial [Eggerthellaceae bacterium]
MTGNETILSYLTNIPAWYLATSVNDQPHVRPFSFAALQDDTLWFCTATTKDVWEELQINPKFEATAWWPGHGWLILRGVAGLVDGVNDTIRQAGFEHMRGLGESYDGAHDPTLVFFSVQAPQAWICTHEEWTP